MNDRPTLQVTIPSDREVVMTRVFDAPRALVFKAMTTPELVKRWMFGPDGWSLPVCELDPTVGGSLRYVWRGPDGAEMGMSGAYREIAPPERIVHTELFDEDWTGGETVVTTVLTERDGRTTVTVTTLFSSKEARDGARMSGMEEGMAMSYDRLDMQLPEMSAG